MKVITVGPDNNTGFRKHIEEVAFCYNGKFISVNTPGGEVLEQIVQEKPDLTIIGARNWIRRNYAILDGIPGKKGLLFVSPLGQNEISGVETPNLIFFMKLLDHKKIDFLFMGSQELTRLINRSDVIYLPAPLISDLCKFKTKSIPGKNIVSILNDKAAHKNTLNSMGGIALAHKVDEFRTNGLSEDYHLMANLFGLKNKLRDVGKLTKEAYFEEIDKAKLLLHLSYSEGLCYGTLEALYRGTPVLVTTAMPWFYHPCLHVVNEADHEEIASKIDAILSLDSIEYSKLSMDCRYLAERKIRDNNQVVMETLKQLRI